jgi:hypothetical protein
MQARESERDGLEQKLSLQTQSYTQKLEHLEQEVHMNILILSSFLLRYVIELFSVNSSLKNRAGEISTVR